MITGDVLLFFGGNGFVDKEIEHYENSMFTHAAVAIDDKQIIEAWWDGVRVTTIDGRGPFAIFRADLDAVLQEDIKMFAVGSVGKRYNYEGLVGFLIEKWMKLKHNPFGSQHSVWCSQLVFECFLASGINLVPGKEAEDITPADLANSPVLRRVTA